MAELFRRFKNIFTVNPNWTSSILPPNSFRVPSPGSLFGYTGAERKPESYTVGYAYFKRDHRRLFPPTVAVTHRSISGLLPIPDKVEAIKFQEQQEEPAVPGKRRVYKKSNDQPPADGYFPIINCD